MTHLEPIHIRNKIQREEFDYPLLSHILCTYAGRRQKIHGLLQSGAIVRVKKGLYVFGHDYRRAPVCLETLANLIYGPSCVSLEYALSFYGLIPERVMHVTSVTSGRDKDFDTPLGRFTYRHLNPKKYAAGINLVWMDPLHPVFFATPEKALADYLLIHKVKGLKSSQDARMFLEEDLRIDSQQWNKINPVELYRMSEVYKVTGLQCIAKLLREGQ
jgi:hypothetical protein